MFWGHEKRSLHKFGALLCLIIKISQDFVWNT